MITIAKNITKIEGSLFLIHVLVVLLLGLKFNSVFADAHVRCIQKERHALLKIKEDLTDDSKFLSSWGNEDDKRDCCKWKGIRCSNKSNHVIMLDLSDANLRGNISPSLLKLQHLNYLDLSYNDFGGIEFPKSICSLKKLRFLKLFNSGFSGSLPKQLGNLSSLHSLNLSYNDLNDYGNLDWLTHLSSLKYLDLNYIGLGEANDWVQVVHKLPHLKILNLKGCALPAVIPPSLSFVNSSKSLAILHLSTNNLTSSIYQWLFNFSDSLVELYLSDINLQGPIPDAFGNMMFLEILDLSVNHHEGLFPEVFMNMSVLRALILFNNNLNGQLLEYVKTLPKNSLETLSLYGNRISGSVPQSIGELFKLAFFDVSFNNLEGVISESHLSNLSKLWYLDLSFNSLVLNFSSYWDPSFQLEVIRLGSCKLGPQFPKWLRTQYDLTELDISNAGISDTIPNWLWDQTFDLEFVNLSHNQIHGRISNLPLGFFYCEFIDLSSNSIEGPIPLLDGVSINLSNNKFSGTISFLCAFSDSNIIFLDLSNNLLSGELSGCLIYLQELQILNLANNNFSGKIPNSMGSLPLIQFLHLRNNSLVGELPLSFKNCTRLTTIDVGYNKLFGPIPTWIGDSLPNLAVFSLRANQFHGSLPSTICHLAHVQLLDFSSNNLSGSIPKCLDNLTAMAQKVDTTPTISLSYYDLHSYEYLDHAVLVWKGREFEYKLTLGLLKSIDFSSNKLNDEIPEEITDLVGLVSLNLSRNTLSGQIPPKIGQLQSIDFLDLSRNQIFGGIPSSLSQLDRLSVLDLSNNNLSGKIPIGTQLQSFNASTYIGNKELCGAPLPKCPGEETAQEPTINGSGENAKIQEDEDRFITLGFYVAMVVGFIVGFWGFCGTLLLNSSWRYAYFKFLTDVKDKIYVVAAANFTRLQRRLCN